MQNPQLSLTKVFKKPSDETTNKQFFAIKSIEKLPEPQIKGLTLKESWKSFFRWTIQP